MTFWILRSDGVWDITQATPEEYAARNARNLTNPLMWPNEWDEDPRAQALEATGHAFTHISILSDKIGADGVSWRTRPFSKWARFPSRSSGVTAAEAWFIDDGVGIAKRWEEPVDLVTDPYELELRAEMRERDDMARMRGDAVRQHYLFEDTATAMMFKLYWSKGS